MHKLRVLDLFSGIGGFSLGLERTGGFETVAFCEIEPFPRRVLAKHWPEVPCYHDVRELTADILRRDGIGVDVICGGFTCQDISTAGKGAGIEGERSGLWAQYARLIGEVRPKFVIVENVAALLGRGLDRVLGDLASIGFDAEWHCIPAAAVGAPHYRDRLWIVAYPRHARLHERRVFGTPSKEGSRPRRVERHGVQNGKIRQRADMADADCQPQIGAAKPWSECDPWPVEPNVGRVAHGVPSRVDRLKGCGNAVVPQIPELIGRAILSASRSPDIETPQTATEAVEA